AALVFKEAADCGFSKATIKRAKRSAGVRTYNKGFGKKKIWFWTTAESGSRRRRAPSGRDGEPLSEPLNENSPKTPDFDSDAHLATHPPGAHCSPDEAAPAEPDDSFEEM